MRPPEKILKDLFCLIRDKKIFEDRIVTIFYWRTLAPVSLPYKRSVLERAVVGLGYFFVSLASSLVPSTTPLPVFV